MNRLAMLGALALCAGTGPNQRQVVGRYFQVLAQPNPTVGEFQELFGRESAAELMSIIAIHAPELKQGEEVPVDAPVVSLANQRLASSGKPSLFLACLKALRPALAAMGGERVVTQRPAGNNARFDVWSVDTAGGKMEFRFAPGSSIIDDVRGPDGRSLYLLIPDCRTVPKLKRL